MELHCLFSLKQLINSTRAFFYHENTAALHKREGLAAQMLLTNNLISMK